MSSEYEHIAQHITFDVETTGLDPRADELKLVCFAKGPHKDSLRHPEDKERIQKWLEHDCYYFAHNSCFDWAFLEHNGYTLPPEDKWRDTQLIAHLIGYRLPGATKLDKLAKDFVKKELLPPQILEPEERVKQWLTRERNKATREGWDYYPQKGHAPFNLLEPYCIADVETTQTVGHVCGGELEIQLEEPEEGMRQSDILNLEHRVLPAIYHTQRRGAPIDIEAARRFQVGVKKNYKKYLDKLREMSGDDEFNPNATRQIETVLRMHGNVDVDKFPKTPKSGAVKLDADTLEAIRDDDPFVNQLLSFREEKKMVEYADALFKFSHDGRLYGTFRQVGTGTGRMSSGEPNLQNLPKDERVRSIFRAVGNMVLVGADYDNMELRMLASLAPGGGIEKALRDGIDLHQKAADDVGGLTRQQGKTLNYSITYGAGITKLSLKLGCSKDEAKDILDRWYEAFPEVAELKAKIKHDLETQRYIKTIHGRRHYIDVNRHYVALNYLIQGSCADVFKLAAARLHEEGLPAILYVHDEIVLEVHEDKSRDAQQRLQTILEEAGGEHGMVAEANVGKKWSEIK